MFNINNMLPLYNINDVLSGLNLGGNNKPSNKSWVSLYANKKGYNHITEATCGISNVGIARKVISAVENEVVDKVIVQWTFIDRFELRWNNDNYQTFAWWNSKDYSTDNKFVNEFREKNKSNTEIATLWYKNIHSKNTAYYYYIKSKNLEQGEIYISPMDLNMEHGVVEVPHRPVIRLVKPLYLIHGSLSY